MLGRVKVKEKGLLRNFSRTCMRNEMQLISIGNKIAK